MPSILLSAPAVEPVTLDEARSFLRVEHNADDEVIAALTAGSRIHVEAQTRRALITQSWRITADSWPQDGRLTVLPAPLQALTAARVYDVDNNAQVVDLQAFVPDLGASALAFAPWALPALLGLLLAAGQSLLGDPNINSAVQSILQPKFIPYYVIAIGIVTELARRRTAGRA